MVVYPRWRGELIYSKPSECIPGGLSPLARGTRRLPPAQPWIFRFIPAGAGNSGPPLPQKCHSPVYPRWRGELGSADDELPLDYGLSPLARGTRVAAAHRWRTHRFIPAGAGNSENSPVSAPLAPVYPRWRGDLSNPPRRRPRGLGLSPLARGTHPLNWFLVGAYRFIPAGAGTSVNITYY